MINLLLDSLYEQIPPAPPCHKGCGECCGSVIMIPEEARRMGVEGRLHTDVDPETLRCEFSDKDTGKCSVYENRPLTCRLFNALKDGPLACPLLKDHGVMTQEEEGLMMHRYFALCAMEGQEAMDMLQKSLAESIGNIVEFDHRKGWLEFDPFTGEPYSNFVGEGGVERDLDS